MEIIVLKSHTPDGLPLVATFAPEKGMNLISYRCSDVEVIDQSTLPLFEERYAGLGALIGPHFHRRRKEILPLIKDESLFPHIARVKAGGVSEPFSHGIARYAPWKAEATESRVSAVLSGKDEWNGVTLASLEGQQFKMRFDAELSPQGLKIDFSITSDGDSLVGLHYYYALTGGLGVVSAHVKPHYNDKGVRKDIPPTWKYSPEQLLSYDLKEEADWGFQPATPTGKGEIALDTGAYALRVQYGCGNDENQWQLYHPKGSSFVCIEPMSAADPRRPQLSASSLHVLITILRLAENGNLDGAKAPG